MAGTPTTFPNNSNGNGNGTPPPQPSVIPFELNISEEDLFSALVKRGKKDPGKISFSPEEEDLVIRRIQDDFQSTNSSLRPFKQNQVEMLKNWRGTKEDKDFPFEGASNIKVPLTSSYIETMQARIIKAFFGDNEKIVEIYKLDEQIDQDKLDEMNQWYHWELMEIVKWKRHMHDIVHNVLLHGIGLSVPTYRHDTRELHSRREFEILNDEKPITELVSDGLSKILEEKSEWGADEPTSVEKQIKPGVFKLNNGRIVFSITSEKDKSPTLVADVWRRETVFDGVKDYCVNLEDLAVINSAQKIDDLPFFGVRLWFDEQDYRHAIDDGFFIDYGEEENKRIMGMADVKIGDELSQEQTLLQDAEDGTDSLDTTSFDPNRKYLEVYRWEGWHVLGTDDYNESTVLKPAVQLAIWVAVRPRRVLKIARLEDLNKDGKRSPIKYDFITEPGRFFSMGLAMWVRHVQAELDAIHNQRLDAGLITNVPFGFYKSTSGIGKAPLINIKPGTLYPVLDPAGINFPRTQWQPTFSFQEESLVKRYGGEQAGLTDPAIGQFTSKRQSASEFVGTASALDLRTEGIVEGFVESGREELQRILGLYQQFGPRERIFRAGGIGGVEITKRFEKDRLQGKILLRLTANLQQINEQLQRQMATDMLQLLLNDYLVNYGIVSPMTIYQAVKKLAKLYHYNGVELHQPNTPSMSDPPNVENHQMFAAQKPKGPTMGEQFDEHLQIHAMLAADTKVMEGWTPAAQQLLQEHIQETLKMKNAAALIAKQQAAMAMQMAGTMAEKGIRPGKSGNQKPQGNLGPGTRGEGVRGADGGAGAPATGAQ